MTGGRVEAVYTLGSVDADMRGITSNPQLRGQSWAGGILSRIAGGTIRAVYSRAAVTAHANNGGGQSTNRAFRAEVIAAGLVVRADGGTEVSKSYAANTPRATKGAETVLGSTSLRTAGAVRTCSGSCGNVAHDDTYWDSTLLPNPIPGRPRRRQDDERAAVPHRLHRHLRQLEHRPGHHEDGDAGPVVVRLQPPIPRAQIRRAGHGPPGTRSRARPPPPTSSPAIRS